ncbi:MAG: hypothetical protein AAGB93_02725 [Planctomycetota bacterium]
MDLDEIWQENKRFITTVGAGLLVFLIASMIVSGLYVPDIKSVTRSNNQSRAKLRTEMYTADDRAQARDENEELIARYERIADVTAFQPRPEFRIDQQGVAPQNVYFAAVEAVEERVTDLASRNRAYLPSGLDLEEFKTQNVDAIERSLHAIDLLERALVMAIESGVKQVKSVEIRLDPAFRSRRGLGALEKTQVKVEIVSDPDAVALWIVACQTPSEDGSPNSVRRQALPIESIDARRTASKADEVKTTVTFLVVRVNEIEEPDAEDA